jgi:hypothetical protein
MLVDKATFIHDLGTALSNGRGYAAGKLGVSEKHLALYPLVRAEDTSRARLFVFFKSLQFVALKQCGVFPATPDFLNAFGTWYAAQVGQLDALGLFLEEPAPWEPRLLEHYRWPCKLMYYLDQEPDRSIPSNDALCYLSLFRGKRVLIICPFAEVLARRANQATFERVWENTGKRWFDPAGVDALEFPYGVSQTTRDRYETVYALLEEIENEMARRTFDVALIAAAAMGIPLAVYARSKGKVAISLGGSLQVLFGVLGRRWRSNPAWMQRYVNRYWIDLPEQYRPVETDVCDNGAYW